MVSHWSVDSEASVRLMAGLFALQADPNHAHPDFWAPFTLVGDGARPLPAMSRR